MKPRRPIAAAACLLALLTGSCAEHGYALYAGPAPDLESDSAAREFGAGALLVDVRPPRDRRPGTRVPGSAVVPFSPARLSAPDPGEREAFLRQIASLAGGDRQRPLILLCDVGQRSAFAANVLREAGFSRAVSLRGGVLGNVDDPGWAAWGYPVE